MASWKIRKAVAALVLSVAGATALTTYEGTRSEAYLDSVGVPTICVGSTTGVRLGMVASDEECRQRLDKDTRTAHDGLVRYVRVPLTQGQYDALLSFTFNVGVGNLSRSTLLRKLNAAGTAQECRGAAQEFSRWVYAGGQRLRGLEARRASERKEFEQGCESWPGGKDVPHRETNAVVRAGGRRGPRPDLALAG